MRPIVFVICLIATATIQAQSGPTYRQLAVEHKGRAGSMSIGCGWGGPPLASIVRFSDLALEGIVLSSRTYATPDDRDIFTEYEIATRQLIFQRTVPRTPMPAPPAPMVFKIRGGTVVFDGYPFTLDVQSDNRRAQLNIGEHVVLFGRQDQDGSWTFGPRDFFQISDGIVQNWLPVLEDTPAEGLEPRMALAAFAQKVRELSR